MTRDGVAGLICLALSIWLWLLSRGLPPSPLVPIGPEYYPRIILALTAVISLALIATDLFSGTHKARIERTGASSKQNFGLVAMTFVVFGIYVGFLPYLGFRLSSLVFVAILQGLLEAPAGRAGWIRLILVSIATTAIAYIVFERYLSVLLPRGIWTGY
jgi:putative tricarboxylic transport membrane protein